MSNKKRRIGILTGGGDVPPLNSVISSALQEAQKKNIELIGFLNGWEGVLKKKYISLESLTIDPAIGGTILRSSRLNLKTIENAGEVIKEKLAELAIEGLIVIGGEDTLSNAFYLKDFPLVLISKTIDNDVGKYQDGDIVNYFTLGYPTAVEKISRLVSLRYGLRTTAYSHERIIVVESMGMHAGWLALSSALGNPDFIIIPEFTIEFDDLALKVNNLYQRQRHVIIVVAEGARWADGSYLSADYNECDDFGHPKFKGSAEILAHRLKDDLKKYFDTRNVNYVNPSYYYRSGSPNKLDNMAAGILGRESIKRMAFNNFRSVFLTTAFDNKKLIMKDYSINEMTDIEGLHRFVNNDLYDREKYAVTKEGIEYLAKIGQMIPQNAYGIPVSN